MMMILLVVWNLPYTKDQNKNAPAFNPALTNLYDGRRYLISDFSKQNIRSWF